MNHPSPTVDPALITGDSHTGSTLTPTEYARLTGLHVRTVREKIRRGELSAHMVKGRHGPEYRILHPDCHTGSPVIGTVDPPAITGATHPEPTEDPPWGSEPFGRVVDLLEEKDRLIDRLSRENVEMAGRLGFVMGQLEETRGRLALLEASKTADPAPASVPTVEAVSAPDSSDQAPQRRPWWAFWQRGSVPTG